MSSVSNVQSEASHVDQTGGCQHYKRNCKLVAPCCNKVYTCRFCHDEDNQNHTINRKEVKEIVCAKCDTRQTSSTICSSCNVKFGYYVCLICNLFDLEDRKQFHCDPCGMCRVGGRENYYHCDKCDICLPTSVKDNHKCVEKVAHGNCPVCLENVHTSRMPSQLIPCGHMIHQACYKELLESGFYSCPLCGRSMVDMSTLWSQMDQEIAETPMPEEYRNVSFNILCKDCNKESKVLFHIIGLKCQLCGSYNTCRSDKADTSDEDDNGENTSSSQPSQVQQPSSVPSSGSSSPTDQTSTVVNNNSGDSLDNSVIENNLPIENDNDDLPDNQDNLLEQDVD